ncbi:MAG TPA: PEP-CTERM sorting domain-containing protein, partial [Urbifossiella sp.]
NGNSYEINYAYDPNAVGSFGLTNFNVSNTDFEAITGGSDVAILAVVPEPNALPMLLGSLGLALGLQRFRRHRRSVV